MMLTSGEDVVSVKMYYAPSTSQKLCKFAEPVPELTSDNLVATTLEHFNIHFVAVPVLSVQNVEGKSFPIALEVFGA